MAKISVASWTVDGYSYDTRKKITLQTANVNSDLTNVIVLVHIDADQDIGGNTTATGTDIRFTSSDGSTEIPYDRDNHTVSGSPSSLTADYWVLSNVADGDGESATDIYIYYDSDNDSDGENAAAVWANYEAVWHLGESSGSAADDTGNGYTGTFNGDLPDSKTGVIGNGQDLDGTDDDVGPIEIDYASQSNITISMWVKYTGDGTDEHTCYGAWTGASDASIMFRIEPSDDTLEGYCIRETDTQVGNNFGDVTAAADTWTRIVLRLTRSGNGLEAFSNATKSSTNIAMSAAIDATTTISGTYIGARNSSSDDQYAGLIDEVRLSFTSISDDEIVWNYHNESEADNELTWGSEETSSGGSIIPIIQNNRSQQ